MTKTNKKKKVKKQDPETQPTEWISKTLLPNASCRFFVLNRNLFKITLLGTQWFELPVSVMNYSS